MSDLCIRSVWYSDMAVSLRLLGRWSWDSFHVHCHVTAPATRAQTICSRLLLCPFQETHSTTYTAPKHQSLQWHCHDDQKDLLLYIKCHCKIYSFVSDFVFHQICLLKSSLPQDCECSVLHIYKVRQQQLHQPVHHVLNWIPPTRVTWLNWYQIPISPKDQQKQLPNQTFLSVT